MSEIIKTVPKKYLINQSSDGKATQFPAPPGLPVYEGKGIPASAIKNPVDPSTYFQSPGETTHREFVPNFLGKGRIYPPKTKTETAR